MKILKNSVAISVAAAGISLAAPASAVTFPAAAASFDIILNVGGMSASQEAVFDDAVNFWESLIAGYAYDISGSGFSNTLTIDAQASFIDGVGGILGSAGPTTAWYSNPLPSPFVYAETGVMNFDTADLTNMENNGSLFEVIVHEMAHVLGIGTLWGYVGAYVQDSGQYTGQYGLMGYQAECDASATFVPVELDGGPGTRNGHWDENWACDNGNQALMTGWLDSPTFLSLATVGSLIDMGYAINLPDQTPQVPLPAGGILVISGLAALGAVSRRRNKKDA